MTKNKLKDSEYLIIKKWYQETEKAMAYAWRTEGIGFDINKVVPIMFLKTSELFQELAPDADIYKLGEVQAQFQPILNKAKEELEKQKRNNLIQHFTREDGILPAMIQSFFHAIARYFRKDNPTVADLMEDAAKIVYKDAQENSEKYTAEREEREQYETQYKENQERADATVQLQSTPEERAKWKEAAARLQAIFDKDSPIPATVLSEAEQVGQTAFKHTKSPSTSSPPSTNRNEGQVPTH